ncbi:NADH-ubiquinone oxidoreductase subunit [Thozetella sp. PMI_491]|nr:NADH-ubiquinone oxidoreductase subunit [Thozetella sp. PMI_491]
MAPHGEDDAYHPKDAVAGGITGALVVGTAGLFTSAVKLALQPRNLGAWSIFRHTGGTTGLFAAAGGVYQFSSYAAANLREKEDPYNTALGGFLAGGRMPRVIGSGAFVAVTLAVFEYTGGKLNGFGEKPEIDEFERKEQLRKNRRRPLEETVAEIGEGRSIRPQGYEERRRERLKEKYGIDINPVSVNPQA